VITAGKSKEWIPTSQAEYRTLKHCELCDIILKQVQLRIGLFRNAVKPCDGCTKHGKTV